MPNVDNALRLAVLGSGILERVLFKRVLSAVAGLLVLAIVIGVLLAAMLAGGLFVLYGVLLTHGWDAQAAALSAGAAGLVLLAVLTAILLHRLHRLRRAFSLKRDMGFSIGQSAQAFIDGLLTPSGDTKDR